MPSRISEVVFSEPSGGLNAYAMFASSLLMASIYVYFGVLRGVTAINALVMAVGFALSGVAESLPAERRRLAGWVRVAAVLLLTGLLGVTVFAPEIVLGPR
ncbi:hypothetical protein EXE43_09755 [Halorubrum sp. SS5]|uniref:Uncharacterized protein n=1 Tax=Halorubrum salinarum TaxID=2739057 RepID=A0A7D3XWH3_9EURY|nr:hypothetical protein [Halorubrum salinarum]QKG93684.1 hypothetical protein HPS36_12715 [Halorubrum salinarum]TKX86175.1 hypothetical protein EXE43_09755 [Halorubrum sp. SS5]